MRLMGKRDAERMVEIGEQILAKPKRKKESNRKQALKSRWAHGTYVGMASRSNESIVVLAEGGPAIKVRTVKRKPLQDRWNAEEILKICATPRKPNPRDPKQEDTRCERMTEGLQEAEEHHKIEIGGEEKDLPDDQADEKMMIPRDFRITKGILENMDTPMDAQGATKR